MKNLEFLGYWFTKAQNYLSKKIKSILNLPAEKECSKLKGGACITECGRGCTPVLLSLYLPR